MSAFAGMTIYAHLFMSLCIEFLSHLSVLCALGGERVLFLLVLFAHQIQGNG